MPGIFNGNGGFGMQMKDKVCVITGAASGIGRFTAEYFGAEGAKVAIVDVQEDLGSEAASGINKKGPGSARFYKCNLRSVKEIEETVAAIHGDFGRIDVLANVAGLSNRTPNGSITEEEWDLMTDVNLKAVFFMTQAAYRIMLEQGCGKIINMSSIRGFCSDGTHTIYDVTKAGVMAIARSFAITGGPRGVTANSLAPGYVLTPMTAHNLENEGWLDHLRSRVPLGRMIEIQEIADAMLFLASDRSSAVSGASLVIDGGRIARD
jgi:NAD(P)-dependent dehydrogenase (short-subunit alcohol dehydrogenase family)